ncbi:hypothetical protein B0H63DRAFT_518653 [Podospora didyma]|uniref:Uncharacterized protein n=1 Tax=Podospora didyma TaxID=330526 RepID=A0AAE0U3M4_9PEZI|nr:hypothetical protein B0H63DRAFT_518653 [Podospora didyma]
MRFSSLLAAVASVAGLASALQDLDSRAPVDSVEIAERDVADMFADMYARAIAPGTMMTRHRRRGKAPVKAPPPAKGKAQAPPPPAKGKAKVPTKPALPASGPACKRRKDTGKSKGNKGKGKKRSGLEDISSHLMPRADVVEVEMRKSEWIGDGDDAEVDGVNGCTAIHFFSPNRCVVAAHVSPENDDKEQVKTACEMAMHAGATSVKINAPDDTMAKLYKSSIESAIPDIDVQISVYPFGDGKCFTFTALAGTTSVKMSQI